MPWNPRWSATARSSSPTELDEAGLGVGAIAGGIRVHVTDLLPGESAEVAIDHRSPHKPEAWGRVTRRIGARRSPDRVAPACPAFGRCGGCVAAPRVPRAAGPQARSGHARARASAIAVAHRWRPRRAERDYRNKGKYVVGKTGGDGRLIVFGAFAPRTHAVDRHRSAARSSRRSSTRSPPGSGARPRRPSSSRTTRRPARGRPALRGRARSRRAACAALAALDRRARGTPRAGSRRSRRRSPGTRRCAAGRRSSTRAPMARSCRPRPRRCSRSASRRWSRRSAASRSRSAPASSCRSTATRPRRSTIASRCWPAPPRACGRSISGAGLGGITFALARAGARVHAVEIDPRAVANLIRAAQRAGHGDRVSARAGDAATARGQADVLVVNPPRKGLGARAPGAIVAARAARDRLRQLRPRVPRRRSARAHRQRAGASIRSSRSISCRAPRRSRPSCGCGARDARRA